MIRRLARRFVLVFCVLIGAGWPAGSASAQTPPPPTVQWYLAEGATGSYFEEDILIGNPNATAADIRITFLRSDGGSTVVDTFTMAPSSRRTVRVNAIAGLENVGAVSAVVESTNGQSIVVERTMYWANGEKRGGHTSEAVAGPAEKWYLAEGATGYFDTFVLIANPDPEHAATVKVTFLRDDSSTPVVLPSFPLAPSQRTTIWVNLDVPDLHATAFSTVVESTNGTKLLVERAMYFPPPPENGTWEAGHGSAAVTGPATKWFFGEGYTGDTPALAFDTFLLLANPGDTKADVTVEFLLDGEASIVKTYPVAPHTRQSVWVDLLPDRDGRLGDAMFSMRVESTQPIIAERAMYWGPQVDGVTTWIEGHNTPGVTAAALKWAFAEGTQGGVDPTGLPFDSYFLIANPSDAALSLRATFLREDGTGIVHTYEVPAKSRWTLPAGLLPEITNQKFAAFFESTNDVPFVAERAMYWGAGWYGGSGATGTPFTGAIATPPAPPLPQVTAIAPAEGFTTGGLEVTITGTNFRAGSTVTIGGAAATQVVTVNATTIRARTPARPAGAADVVVTAGAASTTLTGGFTYVALPQPEINSVSPSKGPTGGGTDVTITGINLATIVEVTFGGLPATRITQVTPTSLVARTPARATPGMVDLTVRSAEGLTATRTDAFTYERALATDNILAFGDSNTEGMIATNCAWVLIANPAFVCQSYNDGGYPLRLRALLQIDYPELTITVNNAGKGGEWAADGRNRLPGVMRASHDLVVIMEGINDLNGAGSGYIPTIESSLRSMVQAAKAAGKAVFLGTVLPVVQVVVDGLPYYKGPGVDVAAGDATIRALNGRIRDVAQQEGATLVDFYYSFTKPGINTASLLSGDGLHPNALGYARMAELVRGHVIEQFDGKPPIVP